MTESLLLLGGAFGFFSVWNSTQNGDFARSLDAPTRFICQALFIALVMSLWL